MTSHESDHARRQTEKVRVGEEGDSRNDERREEGAVRERETPGTALLSEAIPRQENGVASEENNSNGGGEKERRGGGSGGSDSSGSGVNSHGGSASSSGGDNSSHSDLRRIGPWHPPDFKRQLKLASRLSNPEYRSTRSARSRVGPSARYKPEGSRKGYKNSRPGTYNGGSYENRVLEACLSNEPSIVTSPLNYSHRRPRTSTGYSRMSAGSSSSSSPKRELATPRVSPPRQVPLFSTPSDRTVSSEELGGIIGRVTRPTVASRGGVDIANKDFTYIKPPRLKTLPVIPGLDRRYMGLQPVSGSQLNDIVARLTRMTSAYEAKFAQNRNVWVDREPGAHLVRLRKGQPA